tara:strand:- start:363 stop:701 length:339 start_codon:yes stop_codon:yes gene_type:complete
MAPSQKVVPVKLNREQIAVLDRIVELGEFNGRSHAIRELLLPALETGRVAINELSFPKSKAIFRYGVEMKKFTTRMEKISENSKQLHREPKGQDVMPLPGTNEELFPKVILG